MYNRKGHPSSFKGTPEKETPNVLHAPEVHFLDIHCAFSLRKPLQEADYYPWLSEAHEGNTRAFSRNLRFDIRLHRKLSCKYKWSLRKGDSNMLFIPWFCNAYPCWSCYNLTHARTLKKWRVLSCIQIACQRIKYVIYNWTDTLCLFPFSGKNRSCLFRTTYKEVFQYCIVPLDCSNFMFCLRYF